MFNLFTSDQKLRPPQADVGSSGFDLKAAVDADVVVKAGKRLTVPTGIFTSLPIGYEIQVRPRSGLAHKSGITVLNAPGTIDSSYRGEIAVILLNTSDEDFVIHRYDRIAQAVVQRVELPVWTFVSSVDELSVTERGTGGLGSTGIK